MFPTKILLASDGSSEAGRAARMATAVSEMLDSELHVVHVGFVPAMYHPEMRGYTSRIETVRQETQRALDEEVLRIEAADGRVSGSHLRMGRPDAEIAELAEELDAGLVVVGSRGLGPIKRAVLGSVSGSVVRHAHCPVMVVRGETPAVGPIVLAVDGSEEAKLATKAATELSEGTSSEVHLIYVLPTPERMYGPHFYSPDIERQLLERVRAEARKFLDVQAEDVRSGGGRVAQTYLGTGRTDEEIVELAEEIGAGLIVVGSRGIGGVRRALMGSVSDSVVRHAHCPVLVVRAARHP
ncbi:MAG TPA: universal stress protein [Rubrobacter sp.]|nr:universal stress protein [Rubrobacter sp.]